MKVILTTANLIGRYDHGLVQHFKNPQKSSSSDKGVPQPKRSSSTSENTPSDLRRDSKVNLLRRFLRHKSKLRYSIHSLQKLYERITSEEKQPNTA